MIGQGRDQSRCELSTAHWDAPEFHGEAHCAESCFPALGQDESRRGRLPAWSRLGRAALLEQLGAAFDLCVCGILELDPARGGAVALVRAVCEFADDAFEITFARQLKEPDARLVHVIDVTDAGFDCGQRLKQAALAFEQWQPAQKDTDVVAD